METEYKQVVDIDVSLAQNGDGEAFGRLIHKSKHSLYRIAKSILGNEHDVEDTISQTILQAYAKICSLRKNGRFHFWLVKILINECYAILRKRSREVYSASITAAQDIYEDNYNDYELINTINSLKTEQRIVIILFYYEDMSLHEIAKTLEIPEGTVKSRLYRAKEKLRIMLGNSI